MLQLRSEHLVKVYRNRAVVNDVSVEVNQGEIVGLLGPNGAGKTTSFYQIVGLIPPDSGKIFLGDKEITDLPMYQRSQLGVGYLPQEASVFRHLSVEDNIAAVLEMTNLSKAVQKERLEILLAEFGLNRVRKSMGNVDVYKRQSINSATLAKSFPKSRCEGAGNKLPSVRGSATM